MKSQREINAEFCEEVRKKLKKVIDDNSLSLKWVSRYFSIKYNPTFKNFYHSGSNSIKTASVINKKLRNFKAVVSDMSKRKRELNKRYLWLLELIKKTLAKNGIYQTELEGVCKTSYPNIFKLLNGEYWMISRVKHLIDYLLMSGGDIKELNHNIYLIRKSLEDISSLRKRYRSDLTLKAVMEV